MKKLNILLALFMAVISAEAQNVTIAPSRLYYKVDVGGYKSQFVTITNNSKERQSFTLSFSDFEAPGSEGKSKFMEVGESANSCSKWLSASPSFFELEAGKSQQVQVMMQVPNIPEANKVKWSAMRVKLEKERVKGTMNDKNAVGMGITETFQFVVHIFQSPTTVTFKSAEITGFKDITSTEDSAHVLTLSVKNNGEAILDCASYIEITNTQTGNEQRMKPFAFTVLPGGSREVRFQLPVLEKGKYSFLGVVDYGSRENVQAAELNIEVK